MGKFEVVPHCETDAAKAALLEMYLCAIPDDCLMAIHRLQELLLESLMLQSPDKADDCLSGLESFFQALGWSVDDNEGDVPDGDWCGFADSVDE